MRSRTRARRHRLHEGPNPDRWLVSYADFITLLFAFFTTMYAISTVDKRKFESMVNALQSAFAGERAVDAAALARAAAAAGGPVAEPSPPPPVTSALSLVDVRDRLARQLKEAVENGRLDLRMDPRGLVISIRESGSFTVGSAELSGECVTLVSQIADSLKAIGNHIRIEGHTDDVPIHTPKYQSNWELSTARATSVIAFLVQTTGLDPRRLSAAGYGEFYPAAANSSAANRARNRRVDLVVLNPEVRRAEEPAAIGDATPPATPSGR